MSKLIIGNWKMHKTVAETMHHISLLRPLVFRLSADVWLAVPFTDIASASEACKGSRIRVGAQNMSELLAGALTGEISALMLQEAGASFVLLGHSERRRLFSEENRAVNRKAKLAIRHGLTPVICIGETAEEKSAGLTEEVLKKQMNECLEGIIEEFVLAYEPVWAIGSKEAAAPELVEKIHRFCQNYLAHLNCTIKPRVVYGGAVSPDNCQSFLQLAYVDGLLVGGASLEVGSFANIVQKAEG